jgi:hypothetical protein
MNHHEPTSGSAAPTVIVVGSVSGAPGVSSAALGLAALWPGNPGLLVEADPSGGVLAARFRLPQGPGVNDLAAAARHGGVVADPAPFCQQLPLWFRVIAGPGDALQAASAVAVLAAYPDAALRHLAPVVVVDVGRLYPDSPGLGLLPAADRVVVVTHPEDEHLNHAYARLPELRRVAPPGAVGLAVAGKSRYAMDEIAEQMSVPVWAHLPRDRWGSGVLTGRMTGRAWIRTRLGQELKALASVLARQPARTEVSAR